MSENTPRGLLFDLDGVLYNSSQLIPGAVNAIEWVQASGIPYLFVTNTTSRSRAAIAAKLVDFGFKASIDYIFTPAVAASQWLRMNLAHDLALFVRPSTLEEFSGLSCVADQAERGAAYVVIGDLGEHWDYRTLNRAFRLLHYNPQAVLIALGMTRYWRTDDGISLDVAPFVVALEHAIGRKAQVFGKPAAQFFNAAIARLNLAPEQVLMIGDDIEIDVGGAQSAGLQGALVRTGKFRAEDLEGPAKPDHVLDSVADLPNLWSRLTSSPGS